MTSGHDRSPLHFRRRHRSRWIELQSRAFAKHGAARLPTDPVNVVPTGRDIPNWCAQPSLSNTEASAQRSDERHCRRLAKPGGARREVTITECVVIADLVSSSIFPDGVLGAEHDSLLESYGTNLWRGPSAVADMIMGDLRCFLELGAMQQAANLAVVLWMFLSEHPQAGYVCVLCEYFHTICQYHRDIRAVK
jgi:hypothetical protein